MAIVKVSLMITEVDLAKAMQCLMRNALRRSICRSAIGQRGFQMYTRCLHCPYSLRRYRKKDGKPLRDKRDKYYYSSRIFQPNFTFQSFKYIFFVCKIKKQWCQETIATKHASNSLVTFVTQKCCSVLFLCCPAASRTILKGVTFTTNGKRQFLPRDQVFPYLSFTVHDLTKLVVSGQFYP